MYTIFRIIKFFMPMKSLNITLDALKSQMYVYNARPKIWIMTYIERFSQRKVKFPSVTCSQKQVDETWMPAPFFCTTVVLIINLKLCDSCCNLSKDSVFIRSIHVCTDFASYSTSSPILPFPRTFDTH